MDESEQMTLLTDTSTSRSDVDFETLSLKQFGRSMVEEVIGDSKGSSEMKIVRSWKVQERETQYDARPQSPAAERKETKREHDRTIRATTEIRSTPWFWARKRCIR